MEFNLKHSEENKKIVTSRDVIVRYILTYHVVDIKAGAKKRCAL